MYTYMQSLLKLTYRNYYHHQLSRRGYQQPLDVDETAIITISIVQKMSLDLPSESGKHGLRDITVIMNIYNTMYIAYLFKDTLLLL